jgi:sugar-specific transcriptional regulator TrmB
MGYEFVPPEIVAARWWERKRLGSGSRAERKQLALGEPSEIVRANEIVWESMWQGGTDALDLVVALIDAASSEDVIAYVGAGPLEDLLRDHADALVDQVDDLARRSSKFALALSAVYPNDAWDSAVQQRFARWIS